MTGLARWFIPIITDDGERLGIARRAAQGQLRKKLVRPSAILTNKLGVMAYTYKFSYAGG
jgi:hypothetical protein